MDTTSPTPTVEFYQKPNPSRLDPYETYIAELRRCGWPYRKVVEKLRTGFGIEISVSSLHGFCQRRGIGGLPARQTSRPRKSQRARSPKNVQPDKQEEPDEDEFDFDLSKPLQTWKDEV